MGDVYTKGGNGCVPVDVYAYLRHIVFDLCLSLTYGARFGEVDDAFMIDFIAAINAISAVRSSTKTFRHFVPLLRTMPESTSKTIEAERVRRKHRDVLYSRYQARVAAGETVDCIVASLNDDKLTEDEVHGTCLSLLQAAPDSVASIVYQALAWLCSPEGKATQQRAEAAILEAYGGDRTAAWKNAFREVRVPLVDSITKETLRFFTISPYATPRRTVQDVTLPNGVVLPKGITLMMDAQEVNHDEAHFGADAWRFNPDRFINGGAGLLHVGFGAGSRICPAVAISNRLVYALLVRLLLAFEMDGSTVPGRRPNIDAVDFSDVYDELVAHPRFYDCRFTARDVPWLERTLADEQAAHEAALAAA